MSRRMKGSSVDCMSVPVSAGVPGRTSQSLRPSGSGRTNLQHVQLTWTLSWKGPALRPSCPKTLKTQGKWGWWVRRRWPQGELESKPWPADAPVPRGWGAFRVASEKWAPHSQDRKPGLGRKSLGNKVSSILPARLTPKC